MYDYRDGNEVEVPIPMPKLVSWHGRYVTWDMLAGVGVKGPSPVLKAPKTPKARTIPVYDPCLRCQKVLGNYAKGFCFPCYKKEKTKQVDLQGRELHPQYHTPPCSYCGRADQRTYDWSKIEGKDVWYCLDHDTVSKRETTLTESSKV